MKWAVFVSLSTITQIESFFLAVRGKPIMKSILMSSHFHMGIDNGWSTPDDFKWLAFILWQVSHSATYLAISTFILDHQKLLFKILVHLGTAGMNREFGHMSLIKDCLLNFWIDRNHEAFSKPDHILVIPLETRILRISLC
jgi:hypothetical protein